MSAETKKVLEMLAEGKITADEADKLLEKLMQSFSAQDKPDSSSAGTSTTPPSKPSFLRIVLDKPGHDQINVRIPLAFARSGTHLLAVLPERIKEKLSEQGVDFSKSGVSDLSDWQNLVKGMPIDIDRGNGKKVKIFCE